MIKLTLCALAGLLLAGTLPVEASPIARNPQLGILPVPDAVARRWDGDPAGVSQAWVRAVVTDRGWTKLRGADERNHIRHVMWQAMLDGDRLAVYTAQGHPTFRYFELIGEERRELWTYPDDHTQYVFVGDALIERRLR